MIRETVLKDFSNWDNEKQLSELQSYKSMGSYSPFNDGDYKLMEMIINNPNAEVDVECENGVCEIVLSVNESESTNDNIDDESEEDSEIVYDNPEVKLNRRLVDFIDTLYLMNNNKIDEGVVESLKDYIIKMVESITESKILNKIKSLLSMTDGGTLTRLIKELKDKKGFSTKDIRNFKSVFLEGDSTLEEKEEFLNLLISEKKSINASKIKGMTDKTSLIDLVDNDITKLNIFKEQYRDYLEILLDDGTGTGKGEFFLALFGKDIKIKGTPGDIGIDGLALEIKGLSARLQGQNGFGLSTGGWQYLVGKVKKYTKKAEEKNIEVPDMKNPLVYNLKKTGESKLNDLYDFFNETKKMNITRHDGSYYLSSAFGIIYPDESIKNISKFVIDKSIKSGKIVTKDLDKNLVIFNMYYYQNKENFNGIMFINTKKYHAIFINGYEDFEKKLPSFGYSGFSWKDRGSNVHRITLK